MTIEADIMRKCLQPFYTVYVILFFVATLLVVLPFYFLCSLTKKQNTVLWRLTHLWARVWSFGAGMSVREKGSWPATDTAYVIVANHVSYLDPVSLFAAVPFVFRPLAKSEIAKAPLFGYIYARIAVLVDRSSVRKKADSMRQLDAVLRNGQSIFVYPEGTFNETGETTRPFFDGAFRLAVEHSVPILPLIFPDTRERWHYSAWWKIWPGRNRVIILDPIPPSHPAFADASLLRDTVRQQIDEALRAALSA